jgi:hypothetical protein
VLLNPTVIIEVLSPSMEAFDRGEKFRRYRPWLPTLQDYLLGVLPVAVRAKRGCLYVQYFQANPYLGDTDETHAQSPSRRTVSPIGDPV